jgi:hypothetical protein
MDFLSFRLVPSVDTVSHPHAVVEVTGHPGDREDHYRIARSWHALSHYG